MEQHQQQAGQGAEKAQRRAAMPVVAAFIDECRAAYGADMIDRQMAIGMQAARRWHRANAHRCTFYATEGGRTVGLPSPFGQAE